MNLQDSSKSSTRVYCLLTPKEPRPFSAKKTLKIAISVAKSKKKFNLIFFTSNYEILHPTSIKRCGKNFRIFDRIDCKIFALKVEKTSFPAHCGTSFFDFEHF